jgi:hypothetical protein
MNVASMQTIDLHDRKTLIDMADAIIKVECSGYQYPAATMCKAAEMAMPETV